MPRTEQDLAIVGIIPARYGSTRLPGKPLSDIHGKPLIERVDDRARAARTLERVIVATDDERIGDAVQAFGGEAVLTSTDHRTGTDRLAEPVEGESGLAVDTPEDLERVRAHRAPGKGKVA